ncbi:MAG: GNAT family N-acetyltransferase [Cycloclasticus sp.]|nr:GNAT family N-acetyltransferase [Cycloclasticus sp.]
MQASPAFTITTGNWETIGISAKPVRLAVFVAEQGVPNSLEIDPLDHIYLHFIAFDAEQKAIATARMSDDGKFGRMAVLKPYRGQGVGRLLLEAVCQQAISMGIHSIYCHAQTGATGFYQKNGFLTQGEAFEEAGISHIKMHKKLPF